MGTYGQTFHKDKNRDSQPITGLPASPPPSNDGDLNDSFSLSGATSGETTLQKLNLNDSGDTKKKKRKKKSGSKSSRAVSPPPSGHMMNLDLENVTTTSEIV